MVKMPIFILCIFLPPQKKKKKSPSCVQPFVTPWTVAHRIFQARVLEWVAISFSKKV